MTTSVVLDELEALRERVALMSVQLVDADALRERVASMNVQLAAAEYAVHVTRASAALAIQLNVDECLASNGKGEPEAMLGLTYSKVNADDLPLPPGTAAAAVEEFRKYNGHCIVTAAHVPLARRWLMRQTLMLPPRLHSSQALTEMMIVSRGSGYTPMAQITRFLGFSDGVDILCRVFADAEERARDFAAEQHDFATSTLEMAREAAIKDKTTRVSAFPMTIPEPSALGWLVRWIDVHFQDLDWAGLCAGALSAFPEYGSEMARLTAHALQSHLAQRFEPPVSERSYAPVVVGRHRMVLRDNVHGLKPDEFQRLAFRGGVRAIEDACYEELCGVTKEFMEKFLGDAMAFLAHGRGDVLCAKDVTDALRLQGRPLYGFGNSGVEGALQSKILLVLKQVHPGLSITPEALTTTDDILIDMLRRIVQKAASLPRVTAADAEGEEDGGDGPTKWCAATFEIDQTERPKITLYMEDDGSEIPVQAPGSDFMWSTVSADGPAFASPDLSILDARNIQTAVRFDLPGELAKHAVSEGVKAITKFASSLGTSKGVSQRHLEVSARVGLQFDPITVAALARTLCQSELSFAAAVYLAAVLEYLSAEILELSGNAAKKDKSSRISPRHLMLAICNDEELNRMLHQSSIARGGIFPTQWPSATGMPYSHHDFKHPRSSGAGGMEARSEVLRRLVAESRSPLRRLVAEDIGRAVVHPITGFHVAARPEAEQAMADRDSSEDPLDAREALVFAPEAKSDTLTDERGEEFIPSRLYRTLRARTACDHRALAVAVLNDPPASALLRRIREEQQQTSLVFQRVPFAHLVFEVAQGFKPNVRCTPQALDAIQTATESFLVGLFQDTSLIAALPPFHGYIDARRIQLARRIRGERD